MFITPLPGGDRETLRTSLTAVQQMIVNLRSGGPRTAVQRALAYLDKMHEARRLLRTQVHPDTLDQLIPTRTYQLILSAVAGLGNVADGEPIIHGLVATELDERADMFALALLRLSEQVNRYRGDDILVALDTNVFLHHPDKLEDLDIHAAIYRAFEAVHIVVPLIVVDELDRLKQSGNGKSRWRAAYSVAYLDKIARTGGLVRPKDFSDDEQPRGAVTLEILLDPPGHVRQPTGDDEIIERIAALQALAARPVHLVTYDMGMAMRARRAGIPIVQPKMELGEEPK